MKNWMLLVLTAAYMLSCGNSNEENKADSAEAKQVIQNLTEAVKQNPDSAGLRMRLINSLDSLGKYNEAIAQTDSLIYRDSGNTGLWLTKAQLQESNKDTAAAIASYEKAMQIYPSIEGQLNLANLFAETKNEKAVIICNNLYKMGLGREVDANANFITGVYFSRTGNNQQALQAFDKAINDNYTLMEAYLEKCFIYYESKNYPEAIKVLDQAIRVNATYADNYYWKAKCYEAMGNKNEAVINYKRALGLDKQLKEAAEAVKKLEK